MSRKTQKALRVLASELRRAEDALADAEYDLHKWGFSYTPSETRTRLERIEALKSEVAICRRAASVLDEP